jgi:hypothetical protein
MKIKKFLPGLTSGIVLALLVIFGIWPVLAKTMLDAPPKQAVYQPTSQSPENSPEFGSDSFFSIPAAAFGPDGVNPTSYQFIFEGGPIFGGGGGYLVGNAFNYGCMQAPVYLEDGLTIYQITSHVYDNDSSQQVSIYLDRVNKNNGGQNQMASLGSGTSGTSSSMIALSSQSITNNQIDNTDYNYYVYACLPSSNTAMWDVTVYAATYDLAVGLTTQPVLLLPGTTSYTYFASVNNLGSSQATGTHLSIFLPSNATFSGLAGGPGCLFSSGQVSCPIGTLNAGATFTVQINMTLPPLFVGAVTATAGVISTTPDDVPDNNSKTLMNVVGPPIYLPISVDNAGIP